MNVTPLYSLYLSADVMKASDISAYVEEYFYGHIDKKLDSTSVNPVENRAIYSMLNDI